MSTMEAKAQAILDEEGRKLCRALDNSRKAFERGQITPEERLLETCRLVAKACGDEPMSGEARYPRVEVLGWFARAVEMGAEVPPIGERTLEKLFQVQLVPNARFRERFEDLREREGLTPQEVGERIDVTRSAVRDGEKVRIGDATAVERVLGLATKAEKDADGEEYHNLRLFIDYDLAVKLADALGLDYYTVGV